MAILREKKLGPKFWGFLSQCLGPKGTLLGPICPLKGTILCLRATMVKPTESDPLMYSLVPMACIMGNSGPSRENKRAALGPFGAPGICFTAPKGTKAHDTNMS